jgi:hypothetical protein
LHYLRGLLLERERRWGEAEVAFEAALAAPSIMHLQKPALLLLINSQWEQARVPGMANAAKKKERALANGRKFAALGATPKQARVLIDFALTLKDHDLARELVGRWERSEPRSAAALEQRLRIELAAGAYGRVLELARGRRGEAARYYEGQARARILEQAKALAPAKAP